MARRKRKTARSLGVDDSDIDVIEKSINRDESLASTMRKKNDLSGAKYHETAAIGKRELAFDLDVRCSCIRYAAKGKTWDAPMKERELIRQCVCARSLGGAKRKEEALIKRLRKAGKVVSIV